MEFYRCRRNHAVEAQQGAPLAAWLATVALALIVIGAALTLAARR